MGRACCGSGSLLQVRFLWPTAEQGHWGGMAVYNSIVLRAFIEDDDEHTSPICFLFRGEA